MVKKGMYVQKQYETLPNPTPNHIVVLFRMINFTEWNRGSSLNQWSHLTHFKLFVFVNSEKGFRGNTNDLCNPEPHPMTHPNSQLLTCYTHHIPSYRSRSFHPPPLWTKVDPQNTHNPVWLLHSKPNTLLGTRLRKRHFGTQSHFHTKSYI